LPLGAGGRFVAFNGRVYETIVARRGKRQSLDLYHTALVVTVPEERFVIENAWPIPDADKTARGVAVGGPVGFDWLGRFRGFRYEVRCWRNGTIADVAEAVGGAHRVSDDEAVARRVLALVPDVPPLLWGRKPPDAREMWNSNSVISWLLARGGLDIDRIHPPLGGRAPGWSTGLELAHQGPSPGESWTSGARRRHGQPSHRSAGPDSGRRG
jgi:hypothetical protein